MDVANLNGCTTLVVATGMWESQWKKGDAQQSFLGPKSQLPENDWVYEVVSKSPLLEEPVGSVIRYQEGTDVVDCFTSSAGIWGAITS